MFFFKEEANKNKESIVDWDVLTGCWIIEKDPLSGGLGKESGLLL